MRSLPRSAGACAAALTLVVATACSSSAPEPPSPPSPPNPSAAPANAEKTPDLQAFSGQRLDWGPCADYAASDLDRTAFERPELQCARLTVPLDYADPKGKTVSLGLLRLPAKDQAGRVGSLVINPGGPGGSGMRTAASLAPRFGETELGSRFDLVGFDPRGVGASQPSFRCLTDAELDADRLEVRDLSTPEGFARAEADTRDDIQKCVDRVGRDVLATIGTRDVARDVEVLRAALGDAKLTYLGYSYGTRIGTAYAEAFPDRVRAMVLDGAVAPQEDPVTQQVKQVTGFQRSFDAFARWCAQQSGCALGTDPARAVPSFRALVDPLRDQPAPALDRKLSSSDATNGVIQALYDEKLWPFLHKGLQELADGRGDELLRLADLYLDRDRDGRYLRSSELQVAVNCVDGGAVADREVLKEAERRARAAAPFLDDGRPVVDVLEPCAYWPVPPTGGPHEPRVDGLPTTLVISTTGDPATPYQAGVDLARALRARLVTFEGEQHTVALRGVSCVDDAVTRYLVDLALPDEGLTCRR